MNDVSTILVTGGAGFIGSSVVEQLLQQYPRTKVVVLDNLFNGRRQFVPSDARVALVEADLRDSQTMKTVISQNPPGIVIHLAALHFIPYCNEHPAETMQVNVVGTQHLLDACVPFPPQSIVIASSAAVYPICDTPCREEDRAEPSDVYGLSKLTNERQLELFSQMTPTRCVAARFFNAIGPRETNPHLLPAILDQVKAGNRVLKLGNVEPKRDYIHVTDIAKAVVDLAGKNTARYRVYNVGTGKEYSVREIVDSLTGIIGEPLTIATDPKRVRKSDRMHLVADLTRIRKEIGWQPSVELDAGLKALWENEYNA